MSESEGRRQEALAVAERCAATLREQFGARRVVVFGSAAGDGPWHEGSDLDLAVEGLSSAALLAAERQLETLLPVWLAVDLVPLEQVYPEVRAHILGEKKMPEEGLLGLKARLEETDWQEPPEERMGVEAFLIWCDEDVHAEWVEGKVTVMAPASRRHQEFAGFLGALLRIFVEDRQLGTVLSAPFPMRLGPELSVRAPDLLFVAREHEGRLRETYLDGAVDLVVEIVSPESRLRDRGAKFAEYEAAGVREYWLFDLERERVDFYRLDAGGRYRFSDPDAQEVYRALVVPGFWLRLGWVLQRPLPSVLEVLREIGVGGGSGEK